MNSNSFPILRHLSRWPVFWLAVGSFWIASADAAFAQSEEGVKAAFIYNFAKYSDWPSKAFADSNTPITVGFVGAASLADKFEKNVTGKNVNGRDFSVKKYTDAAGVESCHIVVVGDPSQAGAVLALVKGKPVLTVGDNDAFASLTGMINFIKDGAKISFDLDLNAIKDAEMKLDAKLQHVARNVKGT